MRLRVAGAVMLAAAAYYVYLPLPSGVSEPWKLMLLDSLFRSFMQASDIAHALGFCHRVHLLNRVVSWVEVIEARSSVTVHVTDSTLGGVPTRVFQPKEGRKLKRGVIYFHGGGWALASGKMRSYDLLCRKMSEDLDAVIMSVDYRLAPDAVFPDQYHDALAASRAFLSAEVLQRYSIDPERVCVSGDSAGGNLAAAAAQEMKETFARSSVSCLTGSDLHSITAVRGDPCWQVTQQLHLLIEKSVSQQYQRLISTVVKDEVSRVLPSLVMDDRASPRPKVAAHVTGSFAPKLEHAEGGPVSAGRRVQGQKISWWEGRKGLAFLQDVQLVDGELVVSQPGLYYVYAQTYFRHTHSLEEDGEEVEDRGKPLLQYVYKKVSSYPVPILLMKTSRTSCWSRGSDFSLHSAHQGGLFPLTTGDRLFVTVTNASAVDMDEKSSFFGAFLIS